MRAQKHSKQIIHMKNPILTRNLQSAKIPRMDTQTLNTAGAIVGTIFGIGGGIIGTYFALRSAKSISEKKFLKKIAIICWSAVLLLSALIIFLPRSLSWALSLLLIFFTFPLAVYINRRIENFKKH